MSRFARPVPLSERWLERRPFRCEELADRLEWWRAREASFVAHAPFDIEEPGPRLSRSERGLCELWLPVRRIARDARALLRAHFAPGELGHEWRLDLLERSWSWLDARRALASLPPRPSAFLASLADADRAEAFAFELHDPASYGHALDRYPEVVAAIGALSPRRVWDAGCGTGETSFALARVASEVVGTTPCPWELLMARRRGRPHDRARTLRLREATEGVTNVSFERGDLRVEAPQGKFDVVFCGGVLGGVIADEAEIAKCLDVISSALAPGGRVVIADRFRDDVHERASERIRRLAPVGLRIERG